MIKNYIIISISFFILIGCGSAKKQAMPAFNVPQYQEEEEVETSNGISIHGMSGQYPINYKDKQLGDGLFNHKFFDISQTIINRLSENINKEILIRVMTKSNKNDVKVVAKEGVKYFKLHKDFIVWDNHNINTPDVIIKVIEESSVKFIVSYHSEIFSRVKDDVIDLGLNINEIANESTNDWSTITIKDTMDYAVTYQVMKNVVAVSQLDKNKYGHNPATNVKFSDADQYCFEKYSGYLTPVYVFEYALRQGAIKPPINGISQEMIAGYDDANENDKALKKDGDIVKSDMTEDDDAYAEIVIFNHKTKKYNFKRDNFISKSVTFRCSK